MPPVHFVLVILEMEVSQTICPGWPQASIFPISASQVARITGVSCLHLADHAFLNGAIKVTLPSKEAVPISIIISSVVREKLFSLDVAGSMKLE
jgi:hypothetical protein